MTEQNTKIDGRTRRAADIALAKRTISRVSYDAVLAGEITLQQAKNLGRDQGPTGTGQGRSGQDSARTAPRSVRAEGGQGGADTPPQPVSRMSKDDRSRECLCACGTRTKGGRFVPGHDVRMVSYAKEYLRGERNLTDEQMAYVRESGKLDRARTRLAEEERKRQERATKQ
jgi:hypothetical protein